MILELIYKAIHNWFSNIYIVYIIAILANSAICATGFAFNICSKRGIISELFFGEVMYWMSLFV